MIEATGEAFGYSGISKNEAPYIGETPVVAIRGTGDKDDALYLEFADGRGVEVTVEGDCCSYSWIEHASGIEGFVPARLVSIESTGELRELTKEDEEGHEALAQYGTKFVFDNATCIVIEYRNSSNGYYGGWMSYKMLDAIPSALACIEEDF